MRLFQYLIISTLPVALCQCDKSSDQKKQTQGSNLRSITNESESIQQNPATSQLEFPYQTTLENSEGKSLEVILLGRSKGSVTFTKIGSSKPIEYPIPKLNLESAQLVKRFPVKHYRPKITDSSYNEKKIAFLEKRCDELKADMKRYDSDSLKYKSIKKKLKATEAEIKELQ